MHSAARRTIGLGIFLMMVFLILAPAVDAQQSQPAAHRLDAVVVSATRNEIPVFDAAQSVTVVTEEEIMASPFERVEDILRYTVGYYNTSHYGTQTGGISSHFVMRGVGRNRTLMLLDGVPLNDNFNNSIAWVAWTLIPKETIARIEIVRGPTSAVYGSEGLGGVIHIITKNPAPAREASLKLTAGSGETYGGSGIYSQKFERFGFLASGGYDKSDGFYMIDPEDIETYTLTRHRDVGKGFGKITYSLGDRAALDFSALYYQHEMGKGREYFYDDLKLDQYRLGISSDGDRMNWKGNVFLNRADKTAYQDRLIAASGLYVPDRQEMFPENTVWGAEILNTARLGGGVTMSTGVAYKQISMDYDEDYIGSTRDVGAQGNQETIAPFIDVTAGAWDDRLVFNAGLRYDHVRNYDAKSWDTLTGLDQSFEEKTWDNFSPKFGMVYHPDGDTAVRTSIGTGFRQPSLFEQYKLHIRGGGRSVRFPNPDLNPETIVSWDVGAERYFLDTLWAKLTYYQSWASDYIGSRTTKTYVLGGKTYTESENDNISEVNIHGVEAELTYDIGYGLSSFLNYNYNISEVAKDITNSSLEGKYLPGEPQHKTRAGLTYIAPAYVNASIIYAYNAEQYANSDNTIKVPDYGTLDLSIWKTLFERVTLRLSIENITDEEQYVEDGILYYGSVQIQF